MDNLTLVNSFLTTALHLKAQYDDALTAFNDKHLQVISLQNQIADLQQKAALYQGAAGEAFTQQAEALSITLTQAYTDQANLNAAAQNLLAQYNTAEQAYEDKKNTLLSPVEVAQQTADEQAARDVANSLASAKASTAATTATNASAAAMKTYIIWGLIGVAVIVIFIIGYRWFQKRKSKDKD